MRKQKLAFLIIGLPLYVFFFFIIINFYMVYSALYILPFIIIAVATFRRKDFYLRSTKLSILLFLIFILSFPNISDWGNQIYRRVNRNAIIEPYNPFFFTLNTTFHDWFNKTYNMEFDEVTDEINKLQNISSFIYNPLWWKFPNPQDPKHFSLIRYSYDYNYPRLAFDHIPSVSDIINNGFTADCTGIAVFTTSFLRFLGYDAYMTEGDFHEFTSVFLNGTTLLAFVPSIRFEQFRLYYYVAFNPILLNWWPEIGEPYVMYNERYLIIPRPVLSSLGDVYTDAYFFEDFYYDALNGRMMSPFLAWPLVISALFGISFLINYYTKFPRKKRLEKKDLPNILFGGSILTAGAIIIFLFCVIGLYSLGYLSTSIAFFFVFLALDRDFANRLKIFKRFL